MTAGRLISTVVLGLSLIVPESSAAVAADGELVTDFGDNGVVLLDAFDEDSLAIINAVETTQDILGRTVVYRNYVMNMLLTAGRVVTRLFPDGSVDRSFGINGTARFGLPKYGAALAGVEPLPDGRIVSGYSTGTGFGGGLSIISVDGASETLVPLYVPPTEGVYDLARLPDGRIAVASGGPKSLWMLDPDGRLDLSFDGRVDAFAAGSAYVHLEQVVRVRDGTLVAVLATQDQYRGIQSCQLLAFDESGLARALPVESRPANPFLDCPDVVAEPEGTFLWGTDRFDTEGLSRGTSAVAPDAIDGAGRRLVLSSDALTAYESNATPDETFGPSGRRVLPVAGSTFGHVDITPAGNIVVAAAPPQETTRGPGAVAVTLLQGSTGVAPRPPSIASARFVPVAPNRLLDTRIGLGAPQGAVAAGQSVELAVAGTDPAVPGDATSVVVNVTATESAGAGFVSVFPSGAPRPRASSLNLEAAGQTRSNLVTVPVGAAGRITLYTLGATHLVVDIAGYYAPAVSSADGRYVALPPRRLLDTRETGKPAAGSIRLRVSGNGVTASEVSAVAVNLTITDPVAAGFATVWPGGTSQPGTSNANFEPGSTRANLVIVPVAADGSIDIATSVPADVVVDLVGWYTNSTAAVSDRGLFVATGPTRVLDTRAGVRGPIAAGSGRPIMTSGSTPLPVASSLTAVLANVTATDASAPGFVTVWPGIPARPLASTLNVERAGATVANSTIVAMGPTFPDVGFASVNAYSQSTVHLVVDVSGYFT